MAGLEASLCSGVIIGTLKILRKASLEFCCCTLVTSLPAYAASRHRPPASWLPPQRIEQPLRQLSSLHSNADLVSPLVPDKIHPSAADARDGADNAANGVGDVVVG